MNLSNIEFLLAAAAAEDAAAEDEDAEVKERVGMLLLLLLALDAQLLVLVAFTSLPDDDGRPALAVRAPGRGIPDDTEGDVDLETLGSLLLVPLGPVLPPGEHKQRHFY